VVFSATRINPAAPHAHRPVVPEDNGRLIFDTTKTGEKRTVPLPRFLAEQITASFAGKGPDDLVFQGTRGGVLRNVLWTLCNRRPEGLDRPLTAVAYVGPAGLEPTTTAGTPLLSPTRATSVPRRSTAPPRSTVQPGCVTPFRAQPPT
jgi:hypothetical protein